MIDILTVRFDFWLLGGIAIMETVILFCLSALQIIDAYGKNRWKRRCLWLFILVLSILGNGLRPIPYSKDVLGPILNIVPWIAVTVLWIFQSTYLTDSGMHKL